MSNQDASLVVQEPLVRPQIAVMVNLNRPWTVEDARQIAVALDRTVIMAKNGAIVINGGVSEAEIDAFFQGRASLSVVRNPSVPL